MTGAVVGSVRLASRYRPFRRAEAPAGFIASIGRGEAGVGMAVVFQFVDHRDRIIGEADPAVPGVVGHQRVTTQPEVAGAGTFENVGRGREEGPVDVAYAAQGIEEGHAALGKGLPLLWEFRRVDQGDTRRHLETARAAGEEQPPYPGLAQGG
ncbi:hypothetical protein WR25_20365 [Diploscapter pachys]|uniref:Uncharacterized protein n=1 Tax=Diploscapter pachys TaxID=2018661 RepID=A0A2A2K0A5_9BILA|nr:hypothetical protein WR25_20365 [Diploscapter pachys]